MRRWVAALPRYKLILGALLCTGATTLVLAVTQPEPSSRPATNRQPFAQHLEAPQRWFAIEGTVEERLQAGPYVYLRIVGEGRARWVVALAATVPASRSVRVTVLGQAHAFRSARLGRDFDTLLFGVVRPLAAAT